MTFLVIAKGALVLGAVSATAAGGVAASGHARTAAAHHFAYVVRPGDTLSGIAAVFCGNPASFPSLAAANGIADAGMIIPGQRIVIKCHHGHAQAAAPAAPAAAAPAAPAHLSHLASLGINTELSGARAVRWARHALRALGAPTTQANVQTMTDWFSNEGTPHDFNNPLNLQTPHGGSTVSTADNDPPADRIQAYPHPHDFFAAFPVEMTSGSYNAIVANLRAGRGLEGSAASSEIASELSVYSGGGYSSIPAG